MNQHEKVQAIAKILKKRFPNLTVEETIHIAFLILEAIEKPSDKVSNVE